jgi:hypothetical protein
VKLQWNAFPSWLSSKPRLSSLPLPGLRLARFSSSEARWHILFGFCNRRNNFQIKVENLYGIRSIAKSSQKCVWIYLANWVSQMWSITRVYFILEWLWYWGHSICRKKLSVCGFRKLLLFLRARLWFLTFLSSWKGTGSASIPQDLNAKRNDVAMVILSHLQRRPQFEAVRTSCVAGLVKRSSSLRIRCCLQYSVAIIVWKSFIPINAEAMSWNIGQRIRIRGRCH